MSKMNPRSFHKPLMSIFALDFLGTCNYTAVSTFYLFKVEPMEAGLYQATIPPTCPPSTTPQGGARSMHVGFLEGLLLQMGPAFSTHQILLSGASQVLATPIKPSLWK